MGRVFAPWVGPLYQTDGICGVRVLLLGEAHYGVKGEEERETFTQEIVQKLGWEGRHRFFTLVRRLVNEACPVVREAERRDFWERVAFYNFIQAFPGDGARKRPTEQMWRSAQEPFLHTLQELKPEVLLVFGVELSRQLPWKSVPEQIRSCRLAHPASRQFRARRTDAIQQIREAIGHAS